MSLLITGATGAIGSEFLTHYLTTQSQQPIIAVVRSKAKLMTQLQDKHLPHPIIFEGDPTKPALWQEIAHHLKHTKTKLTLTINTIGALHNDTFMPEKNLTQLSNAQFEWSFNTNLMPAALLTQHLAPHMSQTTPTIMAHLSAKIGSIEDNKLGGWYSYRASKAALNMVLKTAAIELKRTHKHLAVLALHPGTINSPLSKPFQKTIPPSNLQSPQTCVQKLLKLIHATPAKPTGTFWSHTGEEIPW